MTIPAFTLTNESITVVLGGRTHTVRWGAPNFLSLRQALVDEDWDAIPRNLTIAKSLKSWAKGKFSVSGEDVLYDGKPIPRELNQRILDMAAHGEDPSSLFGFWERLSKNPSKRSVDQLFSFLSHQGIPLTNKGTFLAYKGVQENYRDVHSGQFDNSPGAVHEMPRNEISDDPNEPCHEGFHVGALEYAQGFGARVVVCEVDPADVVCVPYDSSAQKMRVSKYRVVGNHNGQLLPSTSFQDDDAEDRLMDMAVRCELDGMNTRELLERPLDELRRYASRGLNIVGASRIPGGKTALVSRIVRVRARKS